MVGFISYGSNHIVFRQFIEFLENRRSLGFLNSIKTWYQICNAVSDLCDGALYNPEVCSSEIGIIVDQADSKLFKLRNEEAQCFRFLQRYNTDLAQRHRKLSENLFRLRNETVRFLIRCQGTGPTALIQPMGEGEHGLYYYQALDEVGFNARRLRSEVDRELKSIWAELQLLIQQVELRAAN